MQDKIATCADDYPLFGVAGEVHDRAAAGVRPSEPTALAAVHLELTDPLLVLIVGRHLQRAQHLTEANLAHIVNHLPYPEEPGVVLGHAAATLAEVLRHHAHHPLLRDADLGLSLDTYAHVEDDRNTTTQCPECGDDVRWSNDCCNSENHPDDDGLLMRERNARQSVAELSALLPASPPRPVPPTVVLTALALADAIPAPEHGVASSLTVNELFEVATAIQSPPNT